MIDLYFDGRELKLPLKFGWQDSFSKFLSFEFDRFLFLSFVYFSSD